MNSRITPLQALEKIKDLLSWEMDSKNYKKEINIIENALKEYKYEQILKNRLINIINYLVEDAKLKDKEVEQCLKETPKR